MYEVGSARCCPGVKARQNAHIVISYRRIHGTRRPWLPKMHWDPGGDRYEIHEGKLREDECITNQNAEGTLDKQYGVEA